MVVAVGWSAAEPGPNRPTQPAGNWTLPGASRAVTFAEKHRDRPRTEPVTVRHRGGSHDHHDGHPHGRRPGRGRPGWAKGAAWTSRGGLRRWATARRAGRPCGTGCLAPAVDIDHCPAAACHAELGPA